MFVNFKSENKLLEVFFEEEIDHHSCLLLANLLDDELKKYTPSIVLFNFEKVSFMDSSGIGMLLGRYRKIIRMGGRTEMCSLNSELQRIFEMSGIMKIMPLREECQKNG